jgi:peptidoglycan hydrolase-like protein with peptidoglycan-binding domain
VTVEPVSEPVPEPVSEPEATASRVSLNRRRLLVLGVATAVMTAAGLGAARWVRSPQQALADVRAPEPTTLTVEVERRVLRDTVVLRGEVGAAGTFQVTPAPRNADRVVVSMIRVRPGQRVAPGRVLLEVAGRPLVALPGALPAFRDLRPGSTGKDVRQLQRALRSLGLRTDDPAGVLGPGTKQALTRFYDGLGYPVPVDGDPATLTAGRDRVRAAERALADARAGLAAAGAAPVVGAGAGAGAAEVRTRVRYAAEDLTAARAALAELERTSGPMLPLSEVVFLPAFPARVEKLTATVGAEVAAPLITISSGALVVRARLNPGQWALLKPGMPAEVTAEMLGRTVRGRVAAIGDLAADANGTRSHPMTVTAVGTAWPARLTGQDVRLTVQAASTGERVLVVPVSALFTGADGRVAVLRLGAGGRQQRVVVTPGTSGDGYVGVTPVGAALQPGDRVVVGARETASP